MLLFLREVFKILSVAKTCVEAGITHVEQFLDSNARYVYAKLVTEIGGDRLLQKDLLALTDLVTAPIDAGQQTRKAKAKAAADAAGSEQPPQDGTGAAGAAGPASGIQLTVNPPPAPVVHPAPAAHPATTGHAPASHKPAGSKAGTGRTLPRGGGRRKGG